MDKPLPHPEMTQSMLEITQATIYLMGASFILGSLFTIFLLLMLDFVRYSRNKNAGDRNN